MHLQPNRDYVSNDDVQTPPALARRIVAHFQPAGDVLEPCRGRGSFWRALAAREPRVRRFWAEIKRGRDFFAWHRPVDWIVTNPPWSQLRPFLRHAMTVADEIVFLVTVNHLWTKARLRDARAAGFGIREIVLVDTPATFPASGFQLGAVRLTRGWTGPIGLGELDTTGIRAGRPSGAPLQERSPGPAAPTDRGPGG